MLSSLRLVQTGTMILLLSNIIPLIIGLSTSSSSECQASGAIIEIDELKKLNIDVPLLKQTIASGRIYHQKNFLSKKQIDVLRSDMNQLETANLFKRSGLSDTNRGSNQNFGRQDRYTCETPWWRDSILFQTADSAVKGTDTNMDHACDDNDTKDEEDEEEEEDSETTLASITKTLLHLRHFLSVHLNRQTLTDPTLAHECYYSKSTRGATLSRHMDERHEETKGSRGWLLPSRRSISWLIYLSDEDWDLDINGGALRAFPQRGILFDKGLSEGKEDSLLSSSNQPDRNIQVGIDKQYWNTGCHDGNLQVGWISFPSSLFVSNAVMPVFLDSWFKYRNPQTKEFEPHCILYVPNYRNSESKNHPKDRIFLTQPFLTDAIVGATVSEFIDQRAKLEKETASQTSPNEANLFLRPEYAEEFYLIEDRQAWSSSDANQNQPYNSFIQDVSPQFGSLVLFDSVSVPHEVTLVKNGTRAALAGWFHEETQPFPEDFYA